MTERPPLIDYEAWPSEARHNPPRRNWWSIVALGVVLSLIVAGLAVVGVIVFSVAAMSQYGSNK